MRRSRPTSARGAENQRRERRAPAPYAAYDGRGKHVHLISPGALVAEQRGLALEQASLPIGALVFGDPVPSRSALGQRRRAAYALAGPELDELDAALASVEAMRQGDD